ncbi:MAG: hypothetical protein GVY18_16120 [Bacteroidetes bacterium]|jgi:hypothetical protein|nr:hypothetical protein [Bacteroidota bacterium]
MWIRHLALLLIGGLLLGSSGLHPAHAPFDDLRKPAEHEMDRPGDSAALAVPIAHDPDTAQALARALAAVYATHQDAFRTNETQNWDFDYVSERWREDGEDWKALIASLETDVFPEIRDALRPMAARYGPTWTDIDAAYREAGITNNDVGSDVSISEMYRQLVANMEQVAQFRRDFAAGAYRNVQTDMDLIDEGFFMPEIRVKEAQKVKAYMELAHWFDPQNEDVNALLIRIDDYIDDVREGVEKEIDAGAWPGHAGGAPTHFADDLLAFFRGHEEWGAKPDVDVLAVAVRGGWQPAEYNPVGQVIQWRLPVFVAATKPLWRESSAARVYDLSVVAQKNNPAPRKPPFTGYWVGESYLIRLAKLPQQ